MNRNSEKANEESKQEYIDSKTRLKGVTKDTKNTHVSMTLKSGKPIDIIKHLTNSKMGSVKAAYVISEALEKPLQIIKNNVIYWDLGTQHNGTPLKVYRNGKCLPSSVVNIHYLKNH